VQGLISWSLPAPRRKTHAHYARPVLELVFFWNSGSEAAECSVKMARIITERQNIIPMQGLGLLDATRDLTFDRHRRLSCADV
jgi:4-aminobutyrate aminotransferase-like enzyme